MSILPFVYLNAGWNLKKPEQAGKGSDRSYKTFLKTNRTVYIKREMVPKNSKTPDWIPSATKSRGCSLVNGGDI